MKKLNVQQLFTVHDIGAFAGLFGDVFSKIAVIISALMVNEHIPESLVLAKILPGIAVGSIVGSLLYVREAFLLSRKENRSDVTAIPFGIGSTQVFGWLFIIILPVYRQTGDPVFAWSIGLAACFVGGIVELAGAVLSEYIRKYIPQEALITNMAAAAFIWLAFHGAVNVFNNPLVAIVPLFIACLTIFRRQNIIPFIPNTVLILCAGAGAAWLTGAAGMQHLCMTCSGAGVYPPTLCTAAIMTGLRHCSPYLSIIIPLQIANFLTTMQAVENAGLSGDQYPLRRMMVIDGMTTVISALFGSPFPTTVYYGHAGWKRSGARSAYLFFMVLPYMLLFFGLPLIITACIPFEVIIVFVITAGITVTVDVHNKLAKDYSIALYLSFIPLIAQYITTFMDTVLHACNIASQQLEAAGIATAGLQYLSYGAFASSFLYSVWIVYILQKKYAAAGITCFVLAALSAIGFIHHSSLAFFPQDNIKFVLIYSILSAVCFIVRWSER